MRNIIVKVKAGAKRDEVISTKLQSGGQLLVTLSVRQVPENGKANEEVIKLLARTWKIKKSEIEIISGFKNNVKIIKVERGINNILLEL